MKLRKEGETLEKRETWQKCCQEQKDWLSVDPGSAFAASSQDLPVKHANRRKNNQQKTVSGRLIQHLHKMDVCVMLMS